MSKIIEFLTSKGYNYPKGDKPTLYIGNDIIKDEYNYNIYELYKAIENNDLNRIRVYYYILGINK